MNARDRVLLLKYFDAEAWRRENPHERHELPYALESIASDRVELEWSDRAWRPPWSNPLVKRVAGFLEGLTTPFVDTLLSTRKIGRSDAVLALFESQAMSLALLRSLGVMPYARPFLVVVACWLAELLPKFSPARLRAYQFAYRSVDRLVFFSENQRAVYKEYLRIPDDRLVCVPFGIDETTFAPRHATEDLDVLAVGRDRGRDWATLFAAVADTEWTVGVACRPSQLDGLRVPENVNMLRFVDRETYRDLTARARVVVVPTRELAYPSGQSVVLESLAMEKCCVVTDTPAMRDYVEDGHTALLVPVGDPAALRETIAVALGDPDLRARLGSSGRRAVEDRFNAQHMWRAIAQVILDRHG